MVYELYGYDTEARDDRVREYTSSKQLADLWKQIRRIQFTDSGHGIVFGAKPHTGKRKPTRRRTEHVQQELARLRAEAKTDRVKVPD